MNNEPSIRSSDAASLSSADDRIRLSHWLPPQLGTTDVAVVLRSIDITKDGNSTKLVIDATKDQLKAAPTYDPKVRTYAN